MSLLPCIRHCATLFCRVARCVPTSTQRQLRQYGGRVCGFQRKVLVLTVLGGFYLSVPRCSVPFVVLAQRTEVAHQTVLSDRVVFCLLADAGTIFPLFHALAGCGRRCATLILGRNSVFPLDTKSVSQARVRDNFAWSFTCISGISSAMCISS